jgi:hypothetical protein
MRGIIAIDKIIKWVIAILVLAMILFFFFGNNILGFIGLIPDYSVQDGQEIDFTLLNDDELELLECSNIVGLIKEDRLFLKEFNSEERKLYSTNLKWDDEGFYFKVSRFSEKIYVSSSVDSDVITVGIGFLNDKNYLVLYPQLPYLDELYMFNGSQRLKGTNYLCKTNEQIEEDNKNREERVMELKKGISYVVLFVFVQPFLEYTEDSKDDFIGVYWNFKTNNPGIRIFPNYKKEPKGKMYEFASKEDFNNADKEFLNKLSKRDREEIESLFDSENPVQLAQKILMLFDEKGDKIYAITSDYKYQLEDINELKRINNLLYGVNDIDEFVEGDKLDIKGSASEPFTYYSTDLDSINNKIKGREEFFYSYTGDKSNIYPDYRFYYDADAIVPNNLRGVWKFDILKPLFGRGADGERVTRSLLDSLSSLSSISEDAKKIMGLILDIEENRGVDDE